MRHTAAVITISDKGSRGEREDKSGPALCAILHQQGFDILYTGMVPDEAEKIRLELIKCCDKLRAELVLTTRGNGVFSAGCDA